MDHRNSTSSVNVTYLTLITHYFFAELTDVFFFFSYFRYLASKQANQQPDIGMTGFSFLTMEQINNRTVTFASAG